MEANPALGGPRAWTQILAFLLYTGLQIKDATLVAAPHHLDNGAKIPTPSNDVGIHELKSA